MKKQATKIIKSWCGEQVHAFDIKDNTSQAFMNALGVSVAQDAAYDIQEVSRRYNVATDAAVSPVTTPSNGVPVQFLQFWIKDIVRIMTAARKADELFGRSVVGDFTDEQVVQPVVEGIGKARLYSDSANVPYANINKNMETRDVVRFELGSLSSILQSEQDAKMGVSTEIENDLAVGNALAIALNSIAFNGLNTGRTYGILNDPNLSAYQTVAQGASDETEWTSKTFAEIAKDVMTAIAALRAQTKDLFNPFNDEFTLAVATDKVDFLATPNAIGNQSLIEYLKNTYPKIKINSAPELSGANGGADVFYVWAEKLDGQKVIEQYITSLLRLLGFEKKTKGVLKDFVSSTSGVMVRKPVGVVRYTGI